MPDPNELQLELGLDNEKAIAEATELYDYLAKMTKDIVAMFGEASAKMDTYAEGFSRMRHQAEANMERTTTEVKKASKQVDTHTQKTKDTAKQTGIAGKIMKAAWVDAKAGATTAFSAIKDIAGLGALGGAVGAAGGLVAMFMGSWLTIDKITVAVNKTLVASEGLRGELTIMSSKQAGQYAKTYEEYEKRVHALEKAYRLNTEEASKLVGAYTSVGHEVTDLTKETLLLAGGFDYLIGQPTGKWLTDRANEAATFGDKMEDATEAAAALYVQFGQFTSQGRKSAITITDMQASMETASRTMAGWSSDFRSMNEFQEAFIAGSEEAGMSSKGAADSFGSFVGEISNMDMQQLLLLQDTFKKVASPEMVSTIERMGKEWGEGPLGEAFAMKRFMKTRVEQGDTGDISEYIYSVTASAVDYAKRVGGGDVMGVQALQKLGFSEDNAVKMVKGFEEMQKQYRENGTIAKEHKDAALKDVANAQKRAREATMTLSSKIQAGISLWWREVAPPLFSTIVNGFGLVADGFVFLSTFLKGGDKDERETAKKRIMMRTDRIGENAEAIQKATNAMLTDLGQVIGDSFVRSLGGEALPEYGAKARESKAAAQARRAEEEKATREAGLQGGGGASEMVNAQAAMAAAFGGQQIQAENTSEGVVVTIPQAPQKVLISFSTFKTAMEEVFGMVGETSQGMFGK